jgi:AraC-like DNA-binding protein
MVRARLGEVGITHMMSSAAVAESSDGCVGEWAGSRDGALAITYYKAGHPRLAQAGRTLRLAPGDIVIRDLRRRWQQDSAEDFVLMTVKVPVSSLHGAFADLASFVMVPLRAGDPRADLLSALIESLARVAFSHASVPRADPVERLLRAAMEIAFTSADVGVDADAPPPAALPSVVTSFIESNLGDPELSVANLARHLRLNIRSVQRLFQQAGASPKAYILSRRLESAALQLRGTSALDRASITRLALSHGFNDPGYFSRVFHDAYGMTPSEYRRRYQLPV